MRERFVLGVLLWSLPVCAGEITGRVTLNDKPVAGVTVSALAVELPAEQARREARREPRPAALAKAVTNVKGEYRVVFEAVAGEPGKLVNLACAGGGVASAWLPGRFDTSDVDDAGEFAARKGAPLAGRVVDASGKPIADVQVEHPTGPESTRTGADGTFAFEGAAESGNDVEARLSGYVAAKARSVRGGRKDVTIALKAALPLAGVVVGSDGTPVAHAVLRADGRDARGFAETDVDGRFTLAAFGPGRIAVFADGGERGVCDVTGIVLPRREDEPLRLVLAPPRVLQGRVVDVTTRKPVVGAVVDNSGSRRTWARAGADGSFTLRPAPPGDLRLTVTAPRYAPVLRQVSALEVGGKPVEIFMRPAATFSGRVVDEQRRPVAGARLRAFEPEQRASTGPPPSVTAGEDGSFSLRRVPAVETVRVLASHPDFEPLTLADLGLKPGETRAGVVVALRRGAVVTGIVTAGGEPLAGAQASVAPGRTAYGRPPRSLSGPQWSWPRVTTGPDGRFRLAGLSPGEYVLTVSRPGWATETRDATIADSRGPDPFTIALAPEAVVSGRVVGKKGGGVAAQDVYAQAVETRDRSSGGFDRTAPDGSFRLDGLKPGVAYNLYLYGTGSSTPKAVVTPPAERVEVVVNGTGRLAGRVVDPDGRPVTAYQVTAQADRSSGGSGWFDSARQDVASEAGEFAFENAPAGALEVRVVAKGYQAARVGGVVVEEGESKEGVEVRLSRGASLKGRVVEARGGAPVAGAEVSAESAPSRVVAGADGAFEFEALAPGKVRVTATSPDFVSASENVEVGESGGTVELKLSPGASISAVVVTPGGEPVPGAEVAIGAVGQSWGNTRSVSGADGRVRFAHLVPGRFSLTAGSAGRRSKPVDVTLEADQVRDDVRIVMGGGATVVMTITGVSPDERRKLSAGVSGNRTLVAAQELPDGRWEARDVPPGKAQANARTGNYDSPNSRNVSKPVDVPEEGTLDVELMFEAGFTLTAHVVKDGQGVEGVMVWASAAAAGTATTGQGTTDASGSCRLVGLKAGKYEVSGYSQSNGVEAPMQKVDLAGDQTLEIVLPSGRLAGRVVASGTQQPIANATVTVKAAKADAPYVPTHDATTDDGGRFQFTGLESGSLTLTASRKGYVVETRTVTADPPEDLVISLARGDGLDVTGLDGLLGTPLSMLRVRIYDGAGTEVLETSFPLDSAGRGEIASLKPGSYTIVAAGGSGYAPLTYEGVPVPGPALAVALTPGGTLDVDVAPERLKAGPLACVVAGPRGRLAFWIWGNRGELQIYRSSVHLTNFPPVSGTLSCPGSAPVPFAVTEGGTARIAVK